MTGNFIWYELLTRDLDAAIAFYETVVGWEVKPGETPGMDYRIVHAGDDRVGGMMQAPDPAMPPAWFTYIDVADVDAEVKAFEAAGGKVLWPANTLEGVGRMAMVADPQGAAIYIMTPAMPADMAPEARPFSTAPGHCGWNEYHARDWEAAFAFYAGRFGWEKDTAMDMGAMGIYQTFTSNGARTGGLMNNPLPQQAWLFYFMTGNIDEAVSRITDNGGAIQLPPMEVPGGQWALVAHDPQGAMFGLLGTRG
jgi:hypothetical protein